MPKNTQVESTVCVNERVLFVDSDVKDAEELLASVSADMDVVHLDPAQAPLEQMARSLAGKSNLQEVHLLAHGEPGAMALSGTNVDVTALDMNAESLGRIREAFGEGAKLALWACSVAVGELGRTFTKTLEAAIGVRVFAANGLVGASAKGGSWDIGIASPFSDSAIASYGHTLPTFDGDGGAVDGNQTYTEADNGDGITLTVVFADDVAGGAVATASITNGGGLGGSAGNVFYNNFADETQTVTVTFSSAVDVTSFIYFEADANESGTYTFTPTGGAGTPVVVAAAAFTNADGTLVSPGDWEGVTGFTVTNSGGAFSPGLDSIVYAVHVDAPSEPAIDRTPVNEVGGKGNDTISGLGGDDTLDSGAGDDVVTGRQGSDQIWGGVGDDTVHAGPDDDTVAGGEGNDYIEGGDGSDILFGGSGDDKIYVTEEDNENGDLSSNMAWGGLGNDSLYGGLGSATLGGGNGEDALTGGRGHDEIFGGGCNDELDGGRGDDTLFGGSGNDIVDGGKGDDHLWAGGGDDSLIGGSGADTFIFGINSGNDTISDFDSSEDSIDLTFAVTDFTSLDSVAAAASEVMQNGLSGVLIDLGDSQSVFIQGILLDDLTDSNVIF